MKNNTFKKLMKQLRYDVLLESGFLEAIQKFYPKSYISKKKAKIIIR